MYYTGTDFIVFGIIVVSAGFAATTLLDWITYRIKHRRVIRRLNRLTRR